MNRRTKSYALRLDSDTLNMPVSHQQIIDVQKEDGSLNKCFTSVVSRDKVTEKSCLFCG